MAKQLTDTPEIGAGLVTRKGAAELFGVHMMTITKWEQEGLPVHLRGSRGRPSMYAMPDCIKWFAERELRARGVVEGESLSPTTQRALLDAKRTEELDLRIRLRRGELVEVEEAARDLQNVAAATKARLRRIPAASAEKLVSAAKRGPQHLQVALLTAIDEALRELAALGQATEDAA